MWVDVYFGNYRKFIEITEVVQLDNHRLQFLDRFENYFIVESNSSLNVRDENDGVFGYALTSAKAYYIKGESAV